MTLFRPPILLLLATFIVGVAPAANAADEQSRAGDKGSDQHKQSSRGDDDTLSDAVRRVERATQGQILSAERVQFDGRDIHRVKVVDDRGRVRIYVDDPEKPTRSSNGKPSPRTRRDDSGTPNL